MKKFKKVLVGLFAILLAVVATACSNKSNSSKDGYTPKSLTIQFVPSQAANKLEARAKPLEKMLSKKLGIPVHVSMSTDYNTVVEAMKSKKVDVGFLPPDGYVLAHKQGAANVLLQAQRYGVKQPGGQATKNLVNSYRAEILVKKGSKIKSWKDLKGKSISVQNPTSSAGYVFPVAELEEKGLNVPKDCKLVTVTGHDQAVLNVLNGDTDAAFVFEDARNIVKKDNPKIMVQFTSLSQFLTILFLLEAICLSHSKRNLQRHLLKLVNLKKVRRLSNLFTVTKATLSLKTATSILFVNMTRLLPRTRNSQLNIA